MPEPDGLRLGPDLPAGSGFDAGRDTRVLASVGEATGPDRGREHAILYVVLGTLLLGGSLLLRQNLGYSTGPATHSVFEAISTVLAFIIGGLALVRFYSRKQITFLFIGCGFLGAALLDFNHALITSDFYINARLELDPQLRPADLYAWSWTAGRVFLSGFLFSSLLAWRQEIREDRGEVLPEASVYVTALIMTISFLLFFEWVPLTQATFPFQAVTRPAEFIPALLFLLAFLGFLWKGGWRRDPFEHWLLVSLLISVLLHGGVHGVLGAALRRACSTPRTCSRSPATPRSSRGSSRACTRRSIARVRCWTRSPRPTRLSPTRSRSARIPSRRPRRAGRACRSSWTTRTT